MLITGGNGTCTPCLGTHYSATDQMKFKTQAGSWRDVCQNCTQCGGKNQDGSAFDLIPCNETRDAICTSCLPCPRDASGNLQVRVGCSGQYEGQCAMVDRQVGSILATVAAKPNITAVDTSTFRLSEPLTIELVGDYQGTSLSMPAGLTITFGKQQLQTVSSIGVGFKQLLEWFTVTVIVPGDAMMSEGSSDGADLGLYSNMLYVSPEGITFSEPVNLTFVLFPNATVMRRAAGALPSLSLFSWDTQARTWVRTSDILPESQTGRSATAYIDRFGTYVLAGRARADWPWWWWLILFFLLLVLFCICCICLCLFFCCKHAKQPAPPPADPAFSQRKIEPELPTTPSETAVLLKSPFQLDDSYLANSSPETMIYSATKLQKVEVIEGTYLQDSLASQRITRFRASSPPPPISLVSQSVDLTMDGAAARSYVSPPPVYLPPSISSVPRSPLPTQAVNQLDSVNLIDNMNASLRSLNPRPPVPNHALQVVDDGNVYVSGGVPGKITREFDSMYARRDVPTRAWNSSLEVSPGRDTPMRQAQSYMGQSPRVLPFTVTSSNEVEGDAGQGSGLRNTPEQKLNNGENVSSQSDWC
jgi:hypothetical protein